MRLTAKPLAFIIFAVIFGGIAFTTTAGWWKTKGGGGEPARVREGTQAGMYNPLDIRGSFTFDDVSKYFEVPLDDLQIAFQLPGDVDLKSYKLKSLEALYAGLPHEIGTASVRMFTAYYTGLPYQSSEETFLFAAAVEILEQKGQLTDGQRAYLALHTLDNPGSAHPEADVPISSGEKPSNLPPPPLTPPAAAAPQSEQHVKPARKVNGQTTFQDLLAWGLSQATIDTVIGGPMPEKNTQVRDHCSNAGLQFSTIKTALQAELDKQAVP
jgi:hypothetical protein